MWSEIMNEHCQCISSDRGALHQALAAGGLGSSADSEAMVPLFADYPVFIESETVHRIQSLVAAVHEVIRSVAFVQQAVARAPQVAQVDQGTRGILHGFDFHLTPAGPRLIEINTNAGGALLNVALAKSQGACCDAIEPYLDGTNSASVEGLLVAGFREEFALARGPSRVLRTIAIVDETPSTQFLYPEFVLFKNLFVNSGIQTVIVDPSELVHRDAGLWFGETQIDLVYNRLTDFYFQDASSAALNAAYRANDVVVTPHPRAHALLANKRHLATLSDGSALEALGIAESTIAVLTTMVPRAEVVTLDARERLYKERKRLFFKPLAGYAGKAAYRGDKITRGKFDEMFELEYLAQSVVQPSERVVHVAGEPRNLKVDVRAYVVAERVVLLAARLYQGQTTNFRTPGGGFASVLTI